MSRKIVCSFCKKDLKEVRIMFEGPAGARICDECALNSQTVIDAMPDEPEPEPAGRVVNLAREREERAKCESRAEASAT